MADDTTLTEAGAVEPSILVELLDTTNNQGGAKVSSGRVFLVGRPTLATNADLVDLGAFSYVIIDEKNDTNVEPVVIDEEPAAKPAEVVPPVSQVTNLPGQSGQ